MFIFRRKSTNEVPPAAAIMPVDFFQVKRGKPRGNFFIVGVLSAVILLATVATFITLAFVGSKHVSTVSEVKTADLTGVDGWETCTMISKVNEEYALSTNSSYTLVNVMESKAECTASLAAASPCTSEHIQLIEYDSSISYTFFSDSTTFAIDRSTGNIWAMVELEIGYSLRVYKPSIGAATVEITIATPTPPTTSAIDIDSTGRVVVAYSDYNNNKGLHYYDPSSGAETFVGLSVLPSAIAIDSSDVVWFTYNNYTLPTKILKYDPSTASETHVASFSN